MSFGLSEINKMETKYEENPALEAAQEVAPAEDFACELNDSNWSVVTHNSIAASHLTYGEAAKKAEELKKQGISGICVITDEAAARVSG